MSACYVPCAFLLLVAASVLGQSTLVVPTDVPTIQQAIVQVQPGGTVFVEPGTYPENLDLLGKELSIMAHSPSRPIITGDPNLPHTTVTIAGGQTRSTHLWGLVIAAQPDPRFRNTIEIHNSSPTIEDCDIRSAPGTGNFDTGIIASNSYFALIDCDIRDFFAIPGAYGITIDGNSSVLISGCTFAGLFGDFGAAVDFTGSDLTVRDCMVERCGGHVGAGLILGGGYVRIENTTVRNCSCAGIATSAECVDLANVLLSENSGAFGPGAGIDVQSGSVRAEHITLVNNGYPSVHWPQGGGTFISTQGSFVANNSIIWGNEPHEIDLDGGTAALTYSQVRGGWTGTGNSGLAPGIRASASPQFTSHSWRLRPGSACVDAAGPPILPVPPQDLDAKPRLSYGRRDRGCFEFVPPVAADLHLRQVSGSMLEIAVTAFIPNAPYLTLLGFDFRNATHPTGGRWGGFWLDESTAAAQATLGAPPFFGMLDHSGAALYSAPIPPSLNGRELFGITHVLTSSGHSLIARSPIARLPL